MLTERQAIAQIAQAIADANGTFPIELSATQLAALCGAGGAAKTLADIVTALGDPATAAEVTTAVQSVLKSGTDTAISALLDLVGPGLPVVGLDATGQDGYATVVTAPARVCRNLMISVGANGAIISLNGGTTDHLHIPASTTIVLERLSIASGATIQGKNLDAGQNYANLRIAVW